MDSKQLGGAGSWSSAAPSSGTGSGTSDSYLNASGWQGYEGYGYHSTPSASGSDPSAEQYVYGSSWEPPMGGTESGVATSGNEGRGKGPQPGGGGRSSGGAQADNPDSIIAKINQRLDLLSKESGGKESQESIFRFESFQSYMLPADKEQSVSSLLYLEATAGGSGEASGGGAGVSAGMLSPESGSPYSRGRGGAGRRESSGAGETRARGRGCRNFRAGVRAGQHQQNRAQNRRGGGYWRGRDTPAPPPHQHPHHHSQFSQHPYGCYGVPHPSTSLSSSSSSERLSACWSDLNYVGSCGPGRGPRGRVPSLFPPPYPEFYDAALPPFPPHHLHGHAMMGGFCQPYGGPQGSSGAWNWNGKTWPRGDRDGRRQRGAGPPTRSAEGRKRRFSQTFDDLEAHHVGTESEEDDYDQNPFAKNEDDDDEVVEEGAGEGEKTVKTEGDEEENDEEVKRKRGRKKERHQMDHRLRFTCSTCKFRTVEEKDIQNHLEGRFHKDIFTFLASKMPEAHVKFLQEYTVNRNKKILKKRRELQDKSETHEKSDPFIGAGQDEFLKRIEAAHCMACDMVIPAQHSLLQRHVSSPQHLCNRKGITEHFKRCSLPIAKSILNSSNVSKMLEKYLKGEDPFMEGTGDPDPEEDCDLVRASSGERGASGPRTGALLYQAAHTGLEGAKNDGNEDEGSEDEEKGVFGEPQEFIEESLDEEEEEDEEDAVE